MEIKAVVILLSMAAVSLFITEINGAKRLTKTERRQIRINRRNRNRGPRRLPRTTLPPQRPCPPIPHVTNGQGLGDSGNTVQYACEPGYVLEGTNVITCLDGRWTVAPRCRRQLCPPPTNAINARQPVLSNGGTSAIYSCLAGYEIEGGNGQTSTTINCNIATQFWPVPSCVQRAVVQCGGPPAVTNAQTTLSASGTSATYACITGYVLRSGTPSMILCTNNVWPSNNLPVCDADVVTPMPPVNCPKAPPCGDEKVVREDVADSYEIGGRVMYTCVAGYRIVGENDNSIMTGHAICLSSGTWSVTPTCERKNCGTPLAGMNTQTVVATGTMYGDTYNYVCNTNYETGMLTAATCMADGMWSIPAPTCTQIMCPAAAFPSLANANYAVAPTGNAIGTTVSVMCHGFHRLAPVPDPTVTTLPTTFTLTCQADGTFTSPTQHCVYQHPENCTDFFRRDASSFYNNHDDSCEAVTIDPQGPALTTVTTNPGPAAVRCCKSGDNVCTELVPTVDQPTAACTATSQANSILVAGASITGDTAYFCDEIGEVEYTLDSTEIRSLVASTSGACTQVTTITCDGGAVDNTITPILVHNGETVGAVYGAGAVTLVPDELANLRSCDCAATDTAVGAGCLGGCNCIASIATTDSDTITRQITLNSLAYVTKFGYAQHVAIANILPIGAGDMDISVGSIECCEPYVA